NGVVDRFDRLCFTFGDGELPKPFCLGSCLDRFGVTLGAQNLALTVTFGFEDGGFLLTFGSSDGGGTLAVGFGDHGTAGPFGLHLLVHGVHDVRWWIDPLNLDPDDAHTPFVGGVVEDVSQTMVDRVA